MAVQLSGEVKTQAQSERAAIAKAIDGVKA